MASSKSKASLQSLVGRPTYDVWVEMLRHLGHEGPPHRLAALVAGMLQFASRQKENLELVPGLGVDRLAQANASVTEHEEAVKKIKPLVEKLFDDAGLSANRIDSNGDIYNLAEFAADEYIDWFNIPWES